MNLIERAEEARKRAYAPYSDFSVGAALLTGSGRVYTGCNIENASFSPTLCAERTAFAKAISEGETSFVSIAVVGAKRGEKADKPCPPCGVCRQFMREFCKDDFTVLLSEGKDVRALTLQELLPHSFGEQIKRGER